MSFILDALKKSETDRQRQSGPSLFEVKVAPPRRRLPIWAVAIAVLLAINAIVVSWMLLRRAPAPAAGPAPSPASAPGAAASASAAPVTATRAPAAAPSATVAPPAAAPLASAPSPGSGTAATRSGASAATAALPPATTAGAAPPVPDQAAASGTPSDYAPAVEPGAQDAGGTSTAASGDLPLYQQVVTSDGLPPLHLDLHVFAKSPQDRFVMINMHRLGEGGSLPNGVHVDAIRPDGAVLSYHGTRFLLPRN